MFFLEFIYVFLEIRSQLVQNISQNCITQLHKLKTGVQNNLAIKWEGHQVCGISIISFEV